MSNHRHQPLVPHKGSLCQVDDGLEATYAIEILVEHGHHHELEFTRKDFEFAQRLFAILDTENKGIVDRSTVKEFVTLRCPVFWRRDDDLKRLQMNQGCESPTFDEIWASMAFCCSRAGDSFPDLSGIQIGVEGWMVFCRFVALAQYLEAKRRFSARHLQQTMRHRNSPRGSEVVVVDVPPPEPPVPLSPHQLANYEEKTKAPLPLPELDLDHSLLAAHDALRRRAVSFSQGIVKISLFGSSSFSSSLLNASSGSNLEFAVTYLQGPPSGATSEKEVVVRRSTADMKWLDDTFTEHKRLGGTLCGRILPPFPGSSRPLSSHFPVDDSVLNSSIASTGQSIKKAAKSSVGRIKSAAKSLFGTYLSNPTGTIIEDASSVSSASSISTATQTTASASTNVQPKKMQSTKKNGMSSGRSLPESYYNPNSPAGRAGQLERYLNYLLEHPALSTSFPLNTILKASQSGLQAAKESLDEMNRVTRELKEQTPQIDDGKAAISFWPSSSTSGESSSSPNLAWVRTAAQAAMALKVHGMLETTGMNSASARLQHASLPSFGTAARSGGWEDDDLSSYPEARGVREGDHGHANSFEEGVVTVQSETVGDDGYDLLPLPVPAPERRILSAGSDPSGSSIARETRFHYGSPEMPSMYNLDDEEKIHNAYLGEIPVDENIDKLREVIGSVDNTLSRCLASLGAIGKAQHERQALHLSIVRGLDSWGGMRGRFIAQRSLLKGVSGIEQSKELYEEGDVTMIDDVSWQTSLAKSAVVAAEDVRAAVRVSRTASNAKAAASSAAFAAQTACETGKFSSIDEARAAQTRASIARSHAIHAAVVEHEANTVKRRAALALAHDVKCWNVHRKREMLKSCISYARAQHEATRRAVDAWSSLRDGFIITSLIPPTSHERRAAPSRIPAPTTEAHRHVVAVDPNEVRATIYQDGFAGSSSGPSIVAVEHSALNSFDEAAAVEASPESGTEKDFDFFSSDFVLPLAISEPISEEGGGQVSGHLSIIEGSNSKDAGDIDTSAHDEKLSASMQSLIDGLMHWGGGFEAEEEHFALPAGMAASIVMEGSSVLGTSTDLT